MIEQKGNLWELAKNNIVCVTTNGAVRRDGACVMGRGVAAQAASKWPNLPYQIGAAIRERGNHVRAFDVTGYVALFSFPVKHHWREEADLALIKRSAEELSLCLLGTEYKIYLPLPGCGNGRLNWEDVKPILEPILDNKFYLVSLS